MRIQPDSIIDRSAIEKFCIRWKIKELSLFGSILRDDFGPDSDIDFLVTFEEDARWTLFDIVQMENELANTLDRSVDLVSKNAIAQSPNWKRRKRILDSAQPFISLTEHPVSHELA